MQSDDIAGSIWWFTGLSGAGKTTLGSLLVEDFRARGSAALLIDGDALRAGLCSDLDFSDSGRREQIRRGAELAVLVANQGCHAVVTLIAPFALDRMRAREKAPSAFHEIFVSASLDICQGRDPKGLYRKVQEGSVHQFTGISSVYEPPSSPDFRIDTTTDDVSESLQLLLGYVRRFHS